MFVSLPLSVSCLYPCHLWVCGAAVEHCGHDTVVLGGERCGVTPNTGVPSAPVAPVPLFPPSTTAKLETQARGLVPDCSSQAVFTGEYLHRYLDIHTVLQPPVLSPALLSPGHRFLLHPISRSAGELTLRVVVQRKCNANLYIWLYFHVDE